MEIKEKSDRKATKFFDTKGIEFGEVFSNHILISEYKDGKWSEPIVKPYDKIELQPSISALHYGQSIFEGFKAFRADDNTINIFRPYMNFERFNQSARRLSMPEIPEEIFINGIKDLIEIDNFFVPDLPESSLYIRPLMFATENTLSVRPSKTYKFIVLTCPVGKYYSSPLKMLIETKYARAATGGVGTCKNSGNYAASFLPTVLANQRGFDQVIWTDSERHEHIEEAGIANLMLIKNGVMIVPESPNILQGITRNSVIEIAKYLNIQIETRIVTVNELVDGIKDQSITEVFATGTAAKIAHIVAIGFNNDFIEIPEVDNKFSNKILKILTSIQQGNQKDIFGWITPINIGQKISTF
jgi:branched-chain amino acid aminotransferase, group II